MLFSSIKNKFIDIFMKTVNLIIPKHKYSMYITTMINTSAAHVDIINNGASNALHFAYEYITRNHKENVLMYVEYNDLNRLSLYNNLTVLAKQNNVDLIFLPSHKLYSSKKKKFITIIKNSICRFKTIIWINETGDHNFWGKTKRQKIICFNYFISCKNDYINGLDNRWRYLDGILTTSLLHSQIISSTMGVSLEKCIQIGFPRNDVIFQNSKKAEIYNWLISELGFSPNFIFVYAPTARDYEHGDRLKQRPILGYDINGLDEFLQDNRIAFVYKLHYYQESKSIVSNKMFLKFNESYDFSLYDLLSYTDCVITDYSSIGYDFLLKDKPIIYNLYDYDVYLNDRGFSFDPYDEFCPGPIVHNAEEMSSCFSDIINGIDYFKDKRNRIRRLLFKSCDGRATERAISEIDRILMDI